MSAKLIKGTLVFIPLAMIAGGVACYSIPAAFIILGALIWVDLNRRQ